MRIFSLKQKNEIARLFIFYVLKLRKETAILFTSGELISARSVEEEMKKMKMNEDTSLFWKEVDEKFPEIGKDSFRTQRQGGSWGIINFLQQIEKSSEESSYLSDIIASEIHFVTNER